METLEVTGAGSSPLPLNRRCKIYRIKLEGTGGSVVIRDGSSEKHKLIVNETFVTGGSLDFTAHPIQVDDFLAVDTNPATLVFYYELG